MYGNEQEQAVGVRQICEGEKKTVQQETERNEQVAEGKSKSAVESPDEEAESEAGGAL